MIAEQEHQCDTGAHRARERSPIVGPRITIFGIDVFILGAVPACCFAINPIWGHEALGATLAGLSLTIFYGAWAGSRGTALRPALVWGALTVVLAVLAQLTATGEPIASGQPWTGRLTYLSMVSALAALTSVLGARSPGGGVWSGLMAVLVVVFLVPWLEGPWRMRPAGGLGQLHLDAPWTIFYGLLVVVGATNYLPTRFGLAAAFIGLGFALEYLGLTRDQWSLETRAMMWTGAVWSLAASLATANRAARRVLEGRSRLERLWFWYRDLWGVVWALRMRDRFNYNAELKGWPVRLAWHGVVPADRETDAGADASATVPEHAEAEAFFRSLVRRFATAERLEPVASSRQIRRAGQGAAD